MGNVAQHTLAHAGEIARRFGDYATAMYKARAAAPDDYSQRIRQFRKQYGLTLAQFAR